MLNLNSKILGIKGDVMKLSYPSEVIVEALPKLDGKPNMALLEDDSFKNVILNCLALYATKDKREVMWVSSLANEVISAGDTIELSDAHKKFLVDVLYDQTFQEDEKGKTSGIYMSWITAQILKQLGVE